MIVLSSNATPATASTSASEPSFSERLFAFLPKVGERSQYILAALMWLIGASMLIIRSFGYTHKEYWHIGAIVAGLSLGVIKTHLLLAPAARKAVARIRERGRGHILGFFAARSWILIGSMMGLGIALRTIFNNPGVVGTNVLGAVYVGVGTALALGGLIFWRAAIVGSPQVACVN